MERQAEFRLKLERLRALAAERGRAGVLINIQPNFAWATAGGENRVGSATETGAADLLAVDGRAYLLASNIEAGRVMAEELAGLPQTVTEASLGCGNPLAIADLRPGEVVLDLGSGGGIDCFLAARRVGPAGRVIGLDMTPDMIRLAQRNAKKVGAANVEFRLGEMEDIPLPDRSVDAVISNCVINLSPDKDAVFAEAYRVLRPGGRLSVSDVVVDGELPQAIRERPDIWAACVSGALDEAEYLAKIRAAGFEEVEVLSRDRAEEQEPAGWEDGPDVRELLEGTGWTPRELARRVFSVKVRAVKPVGRPA